MVTPLGAIWLLPDLWPVGGLQERTGRNGSIHKAIHLGFSEIQPDIQPVVFMLNAPVIECILFSYAERCCGLDLNQHTLSGTSPL